MWIVLSFAAAFFAGLTSILAKIGIKNVDSNLAAALRTIVVVIFAWLMVLVSGAFSSISNINITSLVFLILSGLSTGASWLCYFKALQMGDINKVVPIDKSSTVLTMLLAFVFLGEGLSLIKIICMVLIAVGTYIMIERKDISGVSESAKTKKANWLIYALLAALFASLTAILGKIGITGIDSNLGTAIRTMVVLLMAWTIVFAQRGQKNIKAIEKKSWIFISLSGIATGASWLCFYSALQTGPASVVVPIDKLSIVITIAFGAIVFKEKLKIKSLAGLLLIVAGTMWLIFA
jgi:transporter family protein